MELKELEHPSLAIETIRPLESLEAIRIYYCYRGRNAYYRIWATHYFPGCMHQSWASAKAFAETQRAQGSVFYIEQLSSLLLVARDYCVIVTQINSDNPLKDYSYLAMPEKEGWISRKARDTQRVVLTRGVKLEAPISSFAPDSNFWVVPQPPHNSVVVATMNGPSDGFELLDDQPLLKWMSRSIGPNYDLQWREVKPSVTGRAVLNLRHLFNA